MSATAPCWASSVADLQIEYSLLSRGIEAEIRPASRELGIGITAYGVLSRGLLSGHWSRERDVAQRDFRRSARASPARTSSTTSRSSRRCARRRERLHEALGAPELELGPDDLPRIGAAVPRDAAPASAPTRARWRCSTPSASVRALSTGGDRVPRVAYNPLPWMLTPGGFDPAGVPPLPELGALLRPQGLGAIQADVPPGMTPEQFGEALRDAGLAPAPGYFQAPFDDAEALAGTLEAARSAAAGQATLGLTEVFVACPLNPTRNARPGRGVEPDADRLARIGEHLGQAADAMVAEGVRPCLHPHAGTWIETAEEADAVLAATDPAQVLLGPDNGHLTWCGADPVAFVARHAGRVGAVHVKDVHLDRLAAARERGDDYRAVAFGHVITEPGRGDTDIDGFLAALGPDFGGWIVVEVDVFDLPTPEESVAAAGAWVRETLGVSA